MVDIPVKEIGELLDTVSGKVPKLISGLIETVYSTETGKKIGQSVGSLYKELVGSGIPEEDALKMAKDYMLSIKDIAANFGEFSNGNKNNPHVHINAEKGE